MNNLLKTTLCALGAIVISFNVSASEAVHLDAANTDIHDEKSLQRGAKLFMNFCAGCHAISFMRYNRIGKDLNISDKNIAKHLMFNADKVGAPITASIPEDGAKKWFGIVPPDLSLVARARSTDWIYTYLHGFYADESRPFGVNNHVLHNVAMPDVLWKLKAERSTEDFDKDVRDITNFLDYVGEPAKLVRASIGFKVIGFLLILLLLSYLMKKEFWKDVKYGKWRAKD